MQESGAGPLQTPLPSFSSLTNADLTFQRKLTLPQITWAHAARDYGYKTQIKTTKKYYFWNLAGNRQKIWSVGLMDK